MHLKSAQLFSLGENTHKCLPMGVADSPDIFQGKMSELMRALEYVKTYIDDILIISKSNLKDHLEKLWVVLTKLRSAGLKINAKKIFFLLF